MSGNENVGEPGRTRTSNPLVTPEMLCSWFFMHFLVSCITVFYGVRQGFVPKLGPNFFLRQADERQVRPVRALVALHQLAKHPGCLSFGVPPARSTFC